MMRKRDASNGHGTRHVERMNRKHENLQKVADDHAGLDDISVTVCGDGDVFLLFIMEILVRLRNSSL